VTGRAFLLTQHTSAAPVRSVCGERRIGIEWKRRSFTRTARWLHHAIDHICTITRTSWTYTHSLSLSRSDGVSGGECQFSRCNRSSSWFLIWRSGWRSLHW
jgi:hypothetical protein